jgi:signal peptidase II
MFKNPKILLFDLAVLVVLIDQFIKYFVIEKIPTTGIFLVNQTWLQLKIELLYNPYIAFGIKLNLWLVYIFIIILLSVLMILFFQAIKKNLLLQAIPLLVITSAAFSNLIDRVVHGGVVDYLSISVLNYNWPLFNLADTLIVLGAIALIINETRKPICEN